MPLGDAFELALRVARENYEKEMVEWRAFNDEDPRAAKYFLPTEPTKKHEEFVLFNCLL